MHTETPVYNVSGEYLKCLFPEAGNRFQQSCPTFKVIALIHYIDLLSVHIVLSSNSDKVRVIFTQ